jgi:uncharacterized protein YjdB
MRNFVFHIKKLHLMEKKYILNHIFCWLDIFFCFLQLIFKSYLYEKKILLLFSLLTLIIGSNDTFGFISNNNTWARSLILNIGNKASGLEDLIGASLSNPYFENSFQCSTPYQEINGLVVIESENLTLPSNWTQQNSFSGFTGNGYISWIGSQFFSTPGNGLVSTQIYINTPGVYRFQMRSRVGNGNSNTEHNDTWLRFPDASDFFALKGTNKIYPKGSGKTPNPNGAGSNGWFKVYMNSLNWTWSTMTSDNDPHDIYVQFNAPGVYTMELSARSSFHLIDRIVLHQNASNPLLLTNLETKCTDNIPLVPVTGISITPNSLSIESGTSQLLSPNIIPTNATNTNVIWTSSNNNVATINSIGLVTGIASGSATITARTLDGNFIATSSVTVISSNVNLRISSFSLVNASTNSVIQPLNDGDQILFGQIENLNLNFRANTTPSNVGSVFFNLSGPRNSSRTDNGFTYDLFNNTGITLPVGTYTLTAIPYSLINRGGTVGTQSSISFSVVESELISITNVSISPSSATLKVGSSIQINANIIPSNATNKKIIWSTSNNEIASISSSGLVSALAEGETIITAKTEDGGFTSFSSIIVRQSGPNDLVGHWKMDEGSGNVFIDHSGSGNNASIPNSAGVTWVAGKTGLAARFNTSVGALGSVPNNPSVDITGQLTISAWIRPNAVENKGILSKLAGDGYEFRIFSDGKLEFRLNRATSGTAYRLKSNQNYAADGNTWMHVAATFDGSRSTIYINGVEDNSVTFAPVQIISNTANLSLGAIGSGNRWNGDLDDVRLYNRALNGTEIFGLYNGEIPVPAVPELLSPINGGTDISASLGTVLSWGTSEFALGYRIQIALDAGFNIIISDQEDYTETSFLTPVLLPLTQYFWRVSSFNSEENSEWSPTWTFITADESVSDQLIGYWKMDEGSGDIFLDHSGNGNNAFIPNASGVTWVTGIRGLAARLNTDQGVYGSIPHNPSIDLTEQLTISAWIRPNDVENKGILSKLSGDGYEFRIFSDGKLEFRINRASAGTAYRLKSNQNYTADGSTWTHVTATFDGTKSTIYINGVEDNSATFAPVQIISNTADLRIGAVGNGNRWNGDLDDVRLYGRALSSSEILDMFTDENTLLRILDEKEKGQAEIAIDNELLESLGEQDNKFGFKIYPNPVEDRLHIQMRSREEMQVNLMVYDMMGRQYINRSAVPDNGEIVLDLAPVRMAAGTYVLVLDQGQRIIRQIKFIKK